MSLWPESEEAVRKVEYLDPQHVRLPNGEVYPITQAIERLPWSTAYCPTMPHQYVVSRWRSVDPFDLSAVLAMIARSPDAHRAYWRGYQTANRYWYGPDGFRYWTSAGIKPGRGDVILNRTDDEDDTRRIEDGGKPIRDWQGCPWERRSGAGVYERRFVKEYGREAWWPTAEAIANGYQLCLLCSRRPLNSWTPEERRLMGLGNVELGL